MKTLHIASTALLLGLASAASATTINFADFERGTVLSNQIPGVTFSVSGGEGPDGSPLVGLAFGGETGGSNELLNSTTEDYPTNAYLSIVFSAPASDVSFRFNNRGNPDDSGGESGPTRPFVTLPTGLGRGFSTWTAYDINDNIIGSANIWFTTPYELLTVGDGVKTLVITNGTDGQDSWLFSISQLNFNGAIPEPGTWAMMILGFGAIGVTMRRRRTVTA